MPNVNVNDITIEYDTHGNPDNPTVLLIMGLGTQLTGWPQAFCDSLVAHGYHVLRFDNRDIGLSSRLDHERMPNIPGLVILKTLKFPAPAPYTLEDMAADAIGLLNALKIDKAHIVGASMGGMIAQLIAAHYPERTLSLTSIMSTTGHRSLPRADRDATKALMLKPDNPEDQASIIERNVRVRKALQSRTHPKQDEEIRQTATEAVERGGYYPAGVARQLAAIIVAKDRRKLLRTIDAPSLVIHGEEDTLVKVECGIDTAKHLNDGELRILPGMAHDLPTPLLQEIADGIHSVAQRA
ncbi:alpha/beta fold hydrolase [Congregibacter sp.]|uniref:alpha/beta fold hydrolase n=1 Tax=Congregibacter sp. TaxID=2744308 RepID=UPI003F6B6FEC